MALSDEKIQNLQGLVKKRSKDATGKVFFSRKDNQFYQIAHSLNDVTQALAVSPLDEAGNPNYQNTAIVVAGTQLYVKEGLQPTAMKSTINAIDASGVFGLKQGHLTKQYETVKRFYEETMAKIAPYQGRVSNMSGFSQSGPAVAKVAADYHVEKVTNFMDWGSQMAVKNGDITASDLAYLNEHATVYSDAGKNLTYIDGGRGQIAYGQVKTVEGSPSPKAPWKDHDPGFPNIRENDLAIDKYFLKGSFCSGMTQEQVQRVSEVKASQGGQSAESYLAAYEGVYGPFASSERQHLSKEGRRLGTASAISAGEKRTSKEQLREVKRTRPEVVEATRRGRGRGGGRDDRGDDGRD
ncbi:hypothetical protein [Streptococcus dentiloxodontae]